MMAAERSKDEDLVSAIKTIVMDSDPSQGVSCVKPHQHLPVCGYYMTTLLKTSSTLAELLRLLCDLMSLKD